jgi:hypothetical protein
MTHENTYRDDTKYTHTTLKNKILSFFFLTFLLVFVRIYDFKGYTNVLKIDLECPEKYIKAYIFFIFQWIVFKFENLKYISIYLTNIEK